MAPKPAHLQSEYGAQFQDESIAAAYRHRWPYPSRVFDIIERLRPADETRVLDLGCGTGDVCLGIRGQVERIDAVDPSPAMLDAARRRPGADDPRIRWIRASAEAFDYHGPYGVIVAGESFHWMEWEVVLPKVAEALAPEAFLVFVERVVDAGNTWSAQVGALIARHSTNRDYQSYDLVDELRCRKAFVTHGRETTPSEPYEQSIDDYIESYHSKNGLSRQRMSALGQRLFDRAMREMLSGACPDGTIHGTVSGRVTWGRPTAACMALGSRSSRRTGGETA